MKYLLLIGIMLFPSYAFAAVTTTITGQTNNSVTIRVQADHPHDYGPGNTTVEAWDDKSAICIDVFNEDRENTNPGYGDTWSEEIDIAFYADFSVTIPVDEGRYTGIYIAPMQVILEGQGCSNENTTEPFETLLQGSLESPVFTITAENSGGTIDGFNTGLVIATASTTAMLGMLGWAGIKFAFAIIAAAIFIILIYVGFRKGILAMQGKIDPELHRKRQIVYDRLRNSGYSDKEARHYTEFTRKTDKI